jgi:class 3 adenylate cyclase
LLRLAEGKAMAAASGIERALSAMGGDHCARVRLLRAQVEIAIANGDLPTASSASDQLDALVAELGAPSLHAMAAAARGAVLVEQGEAEAAIEQLIRARGAWHELDAPLEVADVRLTLADAFAAAGDEDAARTEARAAGEAYERLGARPGAERARRFLSGLETPDGRGERVGRAFMFTDIVRSTDLIGVIGDDAWEDLLGWHDRTLRSLFVAYAGEVGHSTGDGFFVAFPDAASALRCAIEVERALTAHRRAEGFSVLVRIGVHAGEATRRGEDYSGAEVHRAARIAALADGGEIFASDETLRGIGDEMETSDVGAVTLKGFPEPVSIVRVHWR